MKNSRFSLFIWGLIVLVTGATLFLLNWEIVWFSTTIFWMSLSAAMLGVFLIGMAANNNNSGRYHDLENLKGDSFKIVMFKQVEHTAAFRKYIHMLIHTPTKDNDNTKNNYYTSADLGDFIDPPVKNTWYIFRNGKVIQDTAKSPKTEQVA